MALEIEMQGRDGSTIVKLCGEIDLASAPQLRAALESLVSSGDRIVVDLGEVTFIDSSGLHELHSTAISLDGNGPLRIDNVPPLPMRVMEIVGMTDHPNIEIAGRPTDG
jgi:anti-anti-sigma factor